jgi:hypothetical protein
MTGSLVLFLQSSGLFLKSTPSQAFDMWSFKGYTSTKNGTILKEIRLSVLKSHRRKTIESWMLKAGIPEIEIYSRQGHDPITSLRACLKII